ncbi:hypothetical protein [Actinacidiphila epipremni]|uniref:Uncharacterized protein n=1 Tax=Actinacidiphila epipremni TaxID=2053013 RepID=A0ABX0ZIK5_9ACTN|nr:hypothetical protein [Actinacidiphila epipremni]NJP43131.1 hypothetical protein [Actinacidiphila epipremni]
MGEGAPLGEAEEAALRALLERGVPQLGAPAQRLERVRERVRRRRRRAAAVAGGAVLAVAAGLLAVPGLVRTGGGVSAAPPAGVRGSTPPATAPTGTTMPPATGEGGYRPAGMGGLLMRMPAGWHTLPDPATSSVFTSTQDLALPEGGCAHARDGFCTPLVRALAKGGALVMFREQKYGQAGKMHDLALPVEEQAPYQACRTVGGTRQLTRTLPDESGSDLVVWIVACMAEPTDEQFAAARQILSTAAFT